MQPNTALFLIVAIVLLPLVPAYILFKFLPSDATAEGPSTGLSLKLKGAFAGYFAVLLAVMAFYHNLPTTDTELWTIKGQLVVPKATDVHDIRFSLHPDQIDTEPDKTFTMKILVPRDPQGNLTFPDFVIEHPLYSAQTVHLDQDHTGCTLTKDKSKSEVTVSGECLALTERAQAPAAFQTSLQSVP